MRFTKKKDTWIAKVHLDKDDIHVHIMAVAWRQSNWKYDIRVMSTNPKYKLYLDDKGKELLAGELEGDLQDVFNMIRIHTLEVIKTMQIVCPDGESKGVYKFSKEEENA